VKKFRKWEGGGGRRVQLDIWQLNCMFSGVYMMLCVRGGDYRGDGGTRPPNILEELKGFCIIKI